jgi:hypothetical protein
MAFALLVSVGWLSDAFPMVIEPPPFWTAIANNTEIDDASRRLAVIRLVDRHAAEGMRLTAFTRLFDNPNWLKKTDFTNWNETGLCGWIPVKIDRKNSTTFCFRVFSDIPGDVHAVYFRVSGEVDAATLWMLFHGEKPARSIDATVLEIATSAGRLNLHCRKMDQRSTSTIPTPATP